MYNPIPLTNLLRQNPAVAALIGGTGDTARIHRFGRAPADPPRPYIVWQLITGLPGNNLSDSPDYDYGNVQVDVYADTPQSLDTVKQAIVPVIEAVTHIVSWDGESREKETNFYRLTFSTDWFVER